jgi:hypothetical protein
MALRISTALANHLLQHGSLKNALQGGKIEIYSGAQPATADAAVSGTLLCTITKSSGAHTDEVLAAGSITLTGGAAGSINTLTVNSVNIIPNGAVPFNTSLNQTASDLADAINANQTSPEYRAEASGAVVTITAARGTGAGPNTYVVTASLTTITATYVDMTGGVAQVNGLTLGNAASGVIAKTATETWTGVAVATGTAGWARFVASSADAGTADATASKLRVDGSCATSGAQFNLTSTAFVAGATQTVSSFSFTQPTA